MRRVEAGSAPSFLGSEVGQRGAGWTLPSCPPGCPAARTSCAGLGRGPPTGSSEGSPWAVCSSPAPLQLRPSVSTRARASGHESDNQECSRHGLVSWRDTLAQAERSPLLGWTSPASQLAELRARPLLGGLTASSPHSPVPASLCGRTCQCSFSFGPWSGLTHLSWAQSLEMLSSSLQGRGTGGCRVEDGHRSALWVASRRPGLAPEVGPGSQAPASSPSLGAQGPGSFATPRRVIVHVTRASLSLSFHL